MFSWHLSSQRVIFFHIEFSPTEAKNTININCVKNQFFMRHSREIDESMKSLSIAF